MGGAVNELVSLPWSAFRTRTLPVQIMSEPDGGYWVVRQHLEDKGREQIPRILDRSTGGWLALVSSEAPDARGIGLESQVVLRKIARLGEDGRVLEVCGASDTLVSRSSDPGEGPIFRAYGDFVSGARLLFLLGRSGSKDFVITDDPYEISFDPTDGATNYVDLLGWAMPATTVADLCGQLSLTEAVSNSAPPIRVGRDAAELRVLTPVPLDCGTTSPTTTVQ